MAEVSRLGWSPIPATAQPLGRVRVGGSPTDTAAGVHYVVDAVVAEAEGAQGRVVAPAILLRPLLRRAFDEAVVRAAFAAWRGRRAITATTLLLPGADEGGFLPAPIVSDSSTWFAFLDDATQPLLDLSTFDRSRVGGILRTTLARRPWALVGAADVLADIYPVLSGMDAVNAAFAAVLLFRGTAAAREPQQPAGRPHDLAPPPADIDLFLFLREIGLRRERGAVLGRFAVAGRSILPAPCTRLMADAVEERGIAWTRALRDLVRADLAVGDREALEEDPDLRDDEALTLGPFRAMLVPDLASARALDEPGEPMLTTRRLDAWLASGRAHRMFFTLAAGEPAARLDGRAAALLDPA